MAFSEKPLQNLLATQHGKMIGQCIVDAIKGGQVVVIVMADGAKHSLSNDAAASRVLQERFGWAPVDQSP